MEEAATALDTIKPGHISTVRKLANPPHLITRIMDCVLILFQKRLDICQIDPAGRACLKPSWSESLKLMSSGGFLPGLLNFPKDSINEETVELMNPYFSMEDYNLETAKKVCGDVAGLTSWTIAMGTFFTINKEVLPLKANLIIQEARLGAANKDLAQAQAQLDDKERELQLVQNEYDKAMAEKQALLDDAEGTLLLLSLFSVRVIYRRGHLSIILANSPSKHKIRIHKKFKFLSQNLLNIMSD